MLFPSHAACADAFRCSSRGCAVLSRFREPSVEKGRDLHLKGILTTMISAFVDVFGTSAPYSRAALETSFMSTHEAEGPHLTLPRRAPISSSSGLKDILLQCLEARWRDSRIAFAVSLAHLHASANAASSSRKKSRRVHSGATLIMGCTSTTFVSVRGLRDAHSRPENAVVCMSLLIATDRHLHAHLTPDGRKV
eukprot:5187386-Pleurochrysis_carterae.AAC.4